VTSSSAQSGERPHPHSGHDDYLRVYLAEIGALPLLTRPEEISLAMEMRGGGEKAERARERLIVSNLRLVVKIAKGFKSNSLTLSERISAGNVGLIQSVEKFNPDKGAKFSSYAVWWIKQSIRRLFDDCGQTIRIPVKSAKKLRKIKQAQKDLSVELGRSPSNGEIAGRLNYSEWAIAGLKLADVHFFSLNQSIQEDGSDFEDIVADDDAVIPDALMGSLDNLDSLGAAMELLTPRERTIIELRFGIKGKRVHTLQEISGIVGRTRERVRQIQFSAMDKIKDFLNQ
jgi:RNA polymerase primary sigma factor